MTPTATTQTKFTAEHGLSAALAVALSSPVLVGSATRPRSASWRGYAALFGEDAPARRPPYPYCTQSGPSP